MTTTAPEADAKATRNMISHARDLIAAVAPDHANRAVARLLVDGIAELDGRAAPDWPALPAPVHPDVLADARTVLGGVDMTGWTVNDVGAVYTWLTGHDGASYYTPTVAAEAMVALSIGPQLDRLSAFPDPGSVLGVLAVDPSCGAGVFLVAAARLIAVRYAERLFGGADAITTAIVMPEVMDECVFGIDIDPTAVDLARAALWMEVRGQPITFMDRNIICGDPLSGPNVQPPRLAERLAETTPYTEPTEPGEHS